MTKGVLWIAFIVLYFGFASCFEQGNFLWKDTNGRVLENGKKQIKPKRWTRSLYKWLHSPLINSVEEVIEVDEDNPVASTTQVINRFAREFTEKFEEEFFLWQDGEGNPLRFGLKQIDENIPSEQKVNNEGSQNDKSTQNFSSFWQNPLLYEDNDDIEDDSRDSHLLSFHDDGKLNHFLRNKFEIILNFFRLGRKDAKKKLPMQRAYEESTKISEVKKKGFFASKKIQPTTEDSLNTESEPLTETESDPITERESVNQENKLDLSQRKSINRQKNVLYTNDKSNKLSEKHSKSIERSLHNSANNRSFITTSTETHSYSQIEDSEEKRDYQGVLTQPKVSELNFIENEQNDLESNDNDKLNIDRSQRYSDKQKTYNSKERMNHRKLKRIRKHKIARPDFSNIQSHQFELYETA